MLEVLDLHGNHLAVIDSGVFRDGMNRLNKVINILPAHNPLKSMEIYTLNAKLNNQAKY